LALSAAGYVDDSDWKTTLDAIDPGWRSKAVRDQLEPAQREALAKQATTAGSRSPEEGFPQ
jgi:hypothetical protein